MIKKKRSQRTKERKQYLMNERKWLTEYLHYWFSKKGTEGIKSAMLKHGIHVKYVTNKINQNSFMTQMYDHIGSFNNIAELKNMSKLFIKLGILK